MSYSIAVCNFLCSEGRRKILEYYRKDSCIVTAAIALDVLKHFGIHAKPIPVTTIIFNEAMVQCVEHYGHFPTEQEAQEWVNEYGVWSIGIGARENDAEVGKWNGHLVVCCENRILDLSLDQATRPKYKIHLEPLYERIKPEFFKDKPIIYTQNKCAVTYRSTDDQTFRQTKDWKAQRRQIVVQAIISAFPKLI